jgi:hypothetical protein
VAVYGWVESSEGLIHCRKAWRHVGAIENLLQSAASGNDHTVFDLERWQSGRMYLTRNQAYRKVPWVRIPPSPPASK